MKHDYNEEQVLNSLYRDNRPPLTLAEIRQVKRVILHGPVCTDGRASALILSHVFGSQVTYEFVQYGTDAYTNLEATPGMLFCDFSPPDERVDEFKAVDAIVLDHHKGAKAKTLSFSRSYFGDEVDHPGVSGAVLAYIYIFLPFAPFLTKFFRGPVLEEIAHLIGIRDTWQSGHARWNDAITMHEALSFYTIEELLKVHTFGPLGFWAFGKALANIGPIQLEKHKRTIDKVASRAFPMVSAKGTPVAIFMGSNLVSSAIDRLREMGSTAKLVVGCDVIHDVVDGQVETSYVFSNRSRGDDFDCKSLAKFFGGGGHTNAAGFHEKMGPDAINPYSCFLAKLDAYEADR